MGDSPARATAVASQLSSSRTLSGKRYAYRARAASRVNAIWPARAPATRSSSAPTNRPRSCILSRRGGRVSRKPAIRAKRSSRNFPSRTRLSTFRFVADTSRMSTETASVPPTGRTRCSCRTRRNAACDDRGRSPISSRKKVPRSAERMRPSRSPTAPENAPRVLPNSSLSRSAWGIAPEFTLTNLPDRPESE